MMEKIILFATVIVPIITALVQLVKITVKLPKNFIPVLTFVIGLAVAALAYPFTDLPLDLRLWAGAFAGLAGTGLFELAFNPRTGNTKE